MPSPIDTEDPEFDLLTVLRGLGTYVDKHGFSNPEIVIHKLHGLMGIWVFASFRSYERRSTIAKTLEKITKSAEELVRQINNLDPRTSGLLQFKFHEGEAKIDLQSVQNQLSLLSESGNNMLQMIENKPSTRQKKRQVTDFIAQELFEIFVEFIGKSGKYTKSHHGDRDIEYSGSFFSALKDFYELLGVNRSDTSIAGDIDRITSSPIEISKKNKFLGLDLKN